MVVLANGDEPALGDIVKGKNTCGKHVATVFGTARSDTLRGTKGDDVIVGLAGRDVIRGRGGDDIICSGRRIDWVIGGRGADRIRARGGADFASGGLGKDRIGGGAGRDVITGNRGSSDKCMGGGPTRAETSSEDRADIATCERITHASHMNKFGDRPGARDWIKNRGSA
ncbi:hypothetical protein HJD18_03810 [Thermoleophilia bacterium SCSIO 60948]|nr:hypothetical protein HJD18_03810 [Thermoleophilia bacterium SCSIO 60948]